MTPSTIWTAEDIREELQALERSKAFRRATTLMSLLRFVVEAELAGAGADLKETYLGVSVYRRDPGYDPKADGIVRVNANRLRARLLDHYRQFPSRVQITLEPGSYRPVFIVGTAAIESPLTREPVAEPEAVLPGSGPPGSGLPGSGLPQAGLRHRHLWIGWGIAAVLLLAIGPLLWTILKSQQRWTQRAMSSMSGLQQFPSFSPDSRRVVYAVSDASTGLSSLYTQLLSDSTPVKLTSQPRYETRPAWSPDGNRLAYIVRDANHAVHVMVRGLKEDREEEIYSHAATGPWLCDLSRVTWTRDGAQILTTAPPSSEELAVNPGASPGCGIVAIDLATHKVRRLTHSPAGTQGDLEPAISPDGQTVAFIRQISYATLDIYLIDLDGTHERRLFSVRDDIEGLDWMPDGKQLLLCARMGETQLSVLTLDIRTGKTSVVHSSAAPVRYAVISPDGRHIAYTEYHQQNKVLRLQNGRIQTVFDDGLLRQNVSFSPDGSQLAYNSDRAGRNQIWISDADGHHESLITADAKPDLTRPVWSADGKSLVFECRDKGPSALCALNLASRQIALLVRMKHEAILPSLSRDGTRLYFTSNDTGIYAGYRQRLRTTPDGDLAPDGIPEQMTVGGTAFIYESSSAQTLYLRSPLPSLHLISAPFGASPINTDPTSVLAHRYNLHQQDHISVDDSNTLTEDGLLTAAMSEGRYHFRLYKEGDSDFSEFPAPPIIEPIDSIAWDRKQKAILMTTRSTPVGALISLTK